MISQGLRCVLLFAHVKNGVSVVQVGERIKVKRKALKLTQSELAEKCGWKGQSRISNYESNTRQPKYADLELLAGALQCKIGDLLSDEDFNERQSRLIEKILGMSPTQAAYLESQADFAVEHIDPRSD